jgi:hypothetical protein
MSTVTMFSHLRSQDKKVLKFSCLINITRCPFNTSPHEKISRLRSNKFNNETIFFTHLIHFLYQNLKQFPRVSIRSVSKIQHSNGTVSWHRLISKVIPSTFTQQNEATSWHGAVVFLPWCRLCNQVVSSHYSVSVTTTERLYRRGQKLS